MLFNGLWLFVVVVIVVGCLLLFVVGCSSLFGDFVVRCCVLFVCC